MKTLTPRRLNTKSLMNGILFGILVVFLLIATVGCDKKKSSNNNNFRYCPPNQINCQNYGGGFPGQPGYGQGVVGLGYDQNSGSEVYLEFVAQTGSAYGNQNYINGPTYVYGQIDTNGFQCGNGGFIQGDSYTLESQYPANAQNGVVNNVQLVGYGFSGNQIVVSVSYATMQYPIGGYPSNSYLPLSASMTVMSFNGAPCTYMSVQP